LVAPNNAHAVYRAEPMMPETKRVKMRTLKTTRSSYIPITIKPSRRFYREVK
jgi:hypothetical protein